MSDSSGAAWLIVAALVATVGGVFALAAWNYSHRGQAVMLTALLDDYGESESAADAKYKGQTIRTSGILFTTKKAEGSTYVVIRPSPHSSHQVACFIPEKEIEEATRFTHDAPIDIVGNVDGASGYTVIMKPCSARLRE